MTADCEATSNSSKRRIRKTGRGQSQEEANAIIMGTIVRRSLGGGRCIEKKSNGWEDLEQYSSHGEGPAEVDGPRCCPTHHLA